MHLDLDHAVALAGFAASALDVEGEAPGPVAALARHRDAREELAYRGEERRVGGGIGARRAADRALVDAHRLVEEFQPLDRVVRGGPLHRSLHPALDRRTERVRGEGPSSRTG